MTSPTQRSKALLEGQGCLVAITEKWNPWAKIRQDLFGFIDLLAITPDGETVAIQTTTAQHIGERVSKIEASPSLERLARAGWRVRVHGWAAPTKKRKGWTLKTVDVCAQGGILYRTKLDNERGEP